MPLSPGSRLGVYEVTAQIGEGGMGQVWRATDPDRLARFQREAEVLASLNHPNIAAIYGLEVSPAEAGRHIGTAVASGFSRPLRW